MTITTATGSWVHESAWQAEHSAFAENCSCFSLSRIQRRSWVPAGGRGKPSPLGTRFIQSGRWVLQIKETKDIIAAASLEWDESLFTVAWLYFEDRDAQLTGEANPAFWLIEAVVQRLGPDAVNIHGAALVESLKELGEQKLIAIPTSFGFTKECILKMDRESWKNFSGAATMRRELDWIRKQAARENRVQEFAQREQRRPWLFRILVALSPMRSRRSSKMIHPIDRLKRKLA